MSTWRCDSSRIQRARRERWASSSSASARSSGVVTLRFSCAGAHDDHAARPRARPARRRRSRCASTSVGHVQRALERARGGRPAASAPPTGSSGRASRSTDAVAVGALDRVGDGRRGDRRVGSPSRSQRGEHRLERARRRAAAARRRARAPGLDRRGRRLRAPRAPTPSAPRRPPRRSRPRARSPPAAARRRSARSPSTRAQRVDAPLQQRAAGQLDERLGAIGPEALAAPGGHDQRDGHRSETVAHAPGLAALARARKPRYSAGTAIWLVAESASSSSR